MKKLITWLRNLRHFHHRLMMQYLRKRDWVVFYLEPKHRKCNGTCWLKLYESLIVIMLILAGTVHAGDPNNTVTVDPTWYACPKNEGVHHAKDFVCKIPKQWGSSDLPVIWQGWFGNSNISRLIFRQEQIIENLRKELQRQQAVTYGINVKDKQGKTIHRRGIFDRIVALEDRVKKLEILPAGPVGPVLPPDAVELGSGEEVKP